MEQNSGFFTEFLKKTGVVHFSIAGLFAVISYIAWGNGWFSLGVFFAIFLVIALLQWISCKLFEYVRKKERDEQLNTEFYSQVKDCEIIYCTFSNEMKENIRSLYMMPSHQYSNVRILRADSMPRCRILETCKKIAYDSDYLRVDEGMDYMSYIITFNPIFFQVIQNQYNVVND